MIMNTMRYLLEEHVVKKILSVFLVFFYSVLLFFYSVPVYRFVEVRYKDFIFSKYNEI